MFMKLIEITLKKHILLEDLDYLIRQIEFKLYNN